MLISFVIPLFNEEKRVSKAVESLNRYLSQKDFDSEVLFVNDGSTDRTVEAIKSLKPEFNFKILSYTPNMGKGYAVKAGMRSAKGSYRLITDVDMSTPISEFDKFLPELSKDLVLIGTRKGSNSKVLIRQPFFRQKMGEMYTLLSNILITFGISDFTCGFKCFPQEATQKVFSKALIKRWSYDPEILFLTRKFNYKIQEIAVEWSDDPRTRVKLLTDSLSSLVDLFRIRINDFIGKYN